MTSAQPALGERDATSLLHSRERYLRYLRTRVRNLDVAEDILQDSFLKALNAAPQLRAGDRLVPWFYTILRNAVIDLARRENRVGIVDIENVDLVAEDEEEAKHACDCFVALLPSLKQEYAELIRVLDLEGHAAESVALSLGITTNNLKVRHHRARQALRRRLEETCRVCAQHHCLDCTCREAASA